MKNKAAISIGRGFDESALEFMEAERDLRFHEAVKGGPDLHIEEAKPEPESKPETLRERWRRLKAEVNRIEQK